MLAQNTGFGQGADGGLDSSVSPHLCGSGFSGPRLGHVAWSRLFPSLIGFLTWKVEDDRLSLFRRDVELAVLKPGMSWANETSWLEP